MFGKLDGFADSFDLSSGPELCCEWGGGSSAGVWKAIDFSYVHMFRVLEIKN